MLGVSHHQSTTCLEVALVFTTYVQSCNQYVFAGLELTSPSSSDSSMQTIHLDEIQALLLFTQHDQLSDEYTKMLLVVS